MATGDSGPREECKASHWPAWNSSLRRDPTERPEESVDGGWDRPSSRTNAGVGRSRIRNGYGTFAALSRPTEGPFRRATPLDPPGASQAPGRCKHQSSSCATGGFVIPFGQTRSRQVRPTGPAESRQSPKGGRMRRRAEPQVCLCTAGGRPVDSRGLVGQAERAKRTGSASLRSNVLDPVKLEASRACGIRA